MGLILRSGLFAAQRLTFAIALSLRLAPLLGRAVEGSEIPCFRFDSGLVRNAKQFSDNVGAHHEIMRLPDAFRLALAPLQRLCDLLRDGVGRRFEPASLGCNQKVFIV